MRFFIFIVCLFSQIIAVHAADLLEPEQAFKFSAQLLDADHIEVRYQIADGYYLYRNKFKFGLSDASLGAAQLPPGKIKQDPGLGAMEIYQHEVRIRLPFTRTAATMIKLTSTAQGCAEAGICYTPITSTMTFPLPALPQLAAPVTALPVMQAFNSPAASTFLSADQAFKVTLHIDSPTTIKAVFSLAPHYYLYQSKLHFMVKSPADISISKINLPLVDIKSDPNFGEMKVYHHDFTASLTLNKPLQTRQAIQIATGYQGCSELGICYPPQNHIIQLTAGAADVIIASTNTANASAPQATDNQIERALQGGGFWAVIATFFGAGLLLALTPCVFPMIPILSGIIAGQQQITRLSSFFLSVSYVLGMAITYALVGVAAALSGTLISNTLQNPIALSIGAAVFVGLALSMFGLYELQLPSFIQSKFSNASNRIKGGNLIGVFIMGALSALIIGPCVAPALAAALAYIAQTNNTVLGGWALFALAIGMGVPLLLVGLSAGALLPRAGGWMNGVKNFFGVLMLAVAIWLITPLIAIWIQMLLWSTLLIMSAIYGQVFDPVAHNTTGWQRLWRGFTVIVLIAGIALLLGMLGGGRELLQPLSIYKAGRGSATTSAGVPLNFARVTNNADLDAKIAQSAGKPVMLDFYADWCVSCKEMERNTFSEPAIQSRLKNIVLLQADITANSADDDALRKRFGVFGPPALIFFDSRGKEIMPHVIGYQTPDQFSSTLDKLNQ